MSVCPLLCRLAAVCMALALPLGAAWADAPLRPKSRIERVKECASLQAQAGRLHEEGKHAEAITAARSLLQLQAELYGDESVDSVATHELLARLHEVREEFPAAAAARAAALKTASRRFGEKDHRTRTIRLAQADAARRAALTAPQRQRLREAARSLEQAGKHADNRQFAAAIPLTRAAETTRRELLGEDSAETIDALLLLGGLLDRSDATDGDDTIHKALAACRKTYGLEHPRTFSALTLSAGHFHRRRAVAVAEPLLKECVTVAEPLFGKQSVARQEALLSLVTFYLTMPAGRTRRLRQPRPWR